MEFKPIIDTSLWTEEMFSTFQHTYLSERINRLFPKVNLTPDTQLEYCQKYAEVLLELRALCGGETRWPSLV